ncbi:PREDICTED: spermatid-specific manchette-related protein 1 [Tauraco erythrolophus]|uniref:spermatid-specific manchette-related protein 1 n=1 Tax=Tauraco erythrolophus TaxID=121530 RepID=UPI000523645B|nr:PREDICTED: spermatid-specific manchette-related protein 1 [Tauraco erythrolophus]
MALGMKVLGKRQCKTEWVFAGWKTSHFQMTGGVQRGSYTIHPEFTSEAYPTQWH